MALFVGLLITASIAMFLYPSHHGVHGAVTPGRMGDGGYLKVLVEGTMSMMTNDEKKQMSMAQKEDCKKEKAPEFRADITELPASFDCFGLPRWIAVPLQKWFEPQSSREVNTHFFLSTRSNRAWVEIPWGSNVSMSAIPGFDSRHRTVVIVHGFLAGGNEEWIVDMVDAVLDQIDANVFVVDWSGGAKSWKYWKAVANTRVTGNDVARFMEQLINEAGLRMDNVHLIGHSLGAHICGFVARSLGKVSRITGLDPAQPCFKIRDPKMTLDATDADFVDVIHTNGQMLRRVGLGLPYDIGHSDFYPHGGMVQPECKLKRKLAWWKRFLWRLFLPRTYMLYKKISEAICSHGRAYSLFTESLRKSTACFFWGHPWDMRDTEGIVFERPCDVSHCSEMGYNSDLYPARGGFYVKATNAPPYCVSDRKTDGEMEASSSDRRRKRAVP